MSKTKKRILSKALELFNMHGYANVTIRMIAKANQMSAGNLNYHFQKREDILEALYFEMVAHFDARVERLEETDISFQQIWEDIIQSMERMLHYRFFWSDMYYLLKLNPNINKHFSSVYEKRIRGYQYLYKVLIEKNWMRPPAFDNEYILLAERMLHYGNTWLYGARLYAEVDAIDLAHYARQLIAFLSPYLSEPAKNELQLLST